MKIQPFKIINIEDTFILSDKEYAAILEYANSKRESGNPYNHIREIIVGLGELGATYTRESLRLKVTRSKGTR
jgi:hypothetical protein